jgi:general secretion pathway protein G
MKYWGSTDKKIRGFTLIELLVVIGIIGILTTIVYASFGDARKIARDEIRQTDIKDLQLAIELYKAQNGVYPDQCPSNNGWSGDVNSGSTCTDGTTEYIKGLIAVLPVDPLASSYAANSNFGYIYRVNAAKTEYKIMADHSVERKLITSYNDEFARCPASSASAGCPVTGPQSNTYAVYKGTTAAGW